MEWAARIKSAQRLCATPHHRRTGSINIAELLILRLPLPPRMAQPFQHRLGDLVVVVSPEELKRVTVRPGATSWFIRS